MSNAQEIMNQCTNLLKEEVLFADTIHWLAAAAFAIGGLLMLWRGWITLQKLEDPKTADDMDKLMARNLSAVELKTIAEALAALAKALKDTPVGLTLIIISLALFYLPTASVGAPCADILKTTVEAEAQQDELEAILEKNPTSITVTKTATGRTAKAEWKTENKGTGEAEGGN